MVEDDSPPDRDRGIDFAGLGEALAAHDYPTALSDLVAAHGDHTIRLQNGSRTFREVVGDHTDRQCASPEDARQVVLTLVDESAVGRKGYSDRDPPGPGDSEREEQSF